MCPLPFRCLRGQPLPPVERALRHPQLLRHLLNGLSAHPQQLYRLKLELFRVPLLSSHGPPPSHRSGTLVSTKPGQAEGPVSESKARTRTGSEDGKDEDGTRTATRTRTRTRTGE